MKKLNFSIEINASPERVWDILWGDTTYTKWSSAFTEGSYAVTDWNEGSPVSFMSPQGDGLSSVIEKNVLNRKMTFRHLGMTKNGQLIPPDKDAEDWSGARETYTLTPKGEGTLLELELDTTDADEGYFNKTFPVAFSNIKRLAETK
jgi:uncharacterized protein YndB with AHSA1/START domain